MYRKGRHAHCGVDGPGAIQPRVTRATLRQCAVLAGGLGSRLGALAADRPKPLLPCGDRPFLAWLLREMCRYGVEDILLLAGHLSAELEGALDALAAALPRRMRLSVSVEPSPAGTGGALWPARGQLDEKFLLLNGDSLLDANLAPLLAAAATDGPDVLARLALHRLGDASRSGVVATDGERITAFRERPAPGAPGTINAGVYVLRNGIVDELGPVCSLEHDVLPGLGARGALRGTSLPGWFIDIGVPEDFARAGRELPARLRRPALFLDRDGVINRDHGYVGSIDRFDWILGAREAVRAASDAGWHVFVVTNQSGVARGLYDEAAVRALLDWMADEVRRAGGTIDDMRYCPYHPQATLSEYRQESGWRKPAPGMVLDLLRAWEVDPGACALIGDQPGDLLAAAAAGVAGHLFAGGDLLALVGAILNGRAGPLAGSQHKLVQDPG
jgi:D,D-heptose 1,7-bisphosphate phosphatase